MGKILVNEVDCNQISKYNKPENWVFINKKIAIPKEELKYLKKEQIIQLSSSEKSEEKQVSKSSPSKENIKYFSPHEKKVEEEVSYRGSLLKTGYNLLPESIQQMAVDAEANEAIQMVKKADF